MAGQTGYITADELYGRILQVIDRVGQGSNDSEWQTTTGLNSLMHETLVLACTEGLRHTNYRFGNLSSEVDALCKRHHVKPKDRVSIQRMRRNSNISRPLSPADQLYDCRALSLFVSAVFGVAVPHAIASRVPLHDRPTADRRPIDYLYVRCTVEQWTDETISVSVDQDGATETLVVDYLHTPDFIDLTYLRAILREGMQMNLLNCSQQSGRIVPQLVVVEPDYLVDISVLAACFEDYGHHPLLYLLNRMKPRANTRHTLLGNLAGSILDDAVNHPGTPFAATLRRNFNEKALEFATCPDFQPQAFKEEALRQAAHISQAVEEMFRQQYRRQDALLEPSFVSERLGLQGRVDLMTADMQLLVEQKAGRNIFIERHTRSRHGSIHVEKHYVQALLYYGLMEYNFRKSRHQTDIRLLYSRYPSTEGMVGVEYLQKLFREAIRLRNLIVAQEYDIALNGFDSYLDLLKPENINTEHLDGFFFRDYLLPPLLQLTTPLHCLSGLERSYFCRMMTFVAREQLLAKVGAAGAQGGAASDLWNMPLSEKLQAGNILLGLSVAKRERTLAEGGYDLITLRSSVPVDKTAAAPNFRRGDMVYLYAYPANTTPDARQHILFKGTLAEVGTDTFVVHLNEAQQNPALFIPETHAPDRHPIDAPGVRRSSSSAPMSYAVEHAASDVGATSAIAGLHSFCTAPRDRRDLLLGQRNPQCTAARMLSRPYHPAYDNIVLGAKQADDYYLIIGPPGTGKTSMALQFLVRELTETDGCLLLTAYTNRAVDEICAMLSAHGFDYLRLGNAYSCDPLYRDHLLGGETSGEAGRQKGGLSLDTIRLRISQTPIICATTSTLAARPFIFSLKTFSTIIVDEASQILEPNIIGLLCQNPSSKFILIGDHKQLPAVVRQSERESAVSDPRLQAIGLDNCRNSLFERLLRLERRAGRSTFLGTLNRHGRMHPDIAAWPSDRFYAREQLQPVPLPHQQEVSPQPRIRFIPTPPPTSPTVAEGQGEASLVAHLLKEVSEAYGPDFSAQTTVGVIVPYRSQIALIRQEVARLRLPALQDVSIDTVERYQGSQRDVIIYSFAVNHRYQLDFLTANTFYEDGRPIDRKLNVALTRARRQLILVGREPILRQVPLFADLLDYISTF